MKSSDKWSFIDKSQIKSIFIGKDGRFKVLCPDTKKEIVSKDIPTTPTDSRKKKGFTKDGIFKEIRTMTDFESRGKARRSGRDCVVNRKRNLNVFNQHRKRAFQYPKLRKTYIILLKLMLNLSIEAKDLDLEDFEACILEEILARKTGRSNAMK